MEDIIPIINFILLIFILCVLIWQTVAIEDAQIRLTNNDTAYIYNSQRIKNEFDYMQSKIDGLAPVKAATPAT
jgi:hypothetical protein